MRKNNTKRIRAVLLLLFIAFALQLYQPLLAMGIETPDPAEEQVQAGEDSLLQEEQANDLSSAEAVPEDGADPQGDLAIEEKPAEIPNEEIQDEHRITEDLAGENPEGAAAAEEAIAEGLTDTETDTEEDLLGEGQALSEGQLEPEGEEQEELNSPAKESPVPLMRQRGSGPYVITNDNDPGEKYPLSTYDELQAKITELAAQNKAYTLTLNQDLEVTGNKSLAFHGPSKWTVQGKGHTVKKQTGYPGGEIPVVYVVRTNRPSEVILQDVIIDGGNEHRGCHLAEGTLTLESGAIIQNGYTFLSQTGGIYMRPNTALYLKNGSKILNNKSHSTGSYYGGAIRMSSGCTVDIDGAEISGNEVAQLGGAIYAPSNATSLTIKNTTFSNNKANFGGAVFSQTVTKVTDTVFQTNTAGQGGAIAQWADTLDVSRCNFSENIATRRGGALALGIETDEIQITDSTFLKNKARSSDNGFGGAICRYTAYDDPPTGTLGKVTLRNTDFTENEALYQGGGIYLCGDLEMSDISFEKNSSDFQGGALYLLHGNTDITKATFSENASFHAGGAIGLYDGGSLSVTESIFVRNKTTTMNEDSGTGGAIFTRNTSVTLDIDQCNFQENEAQHGGALHLRQNSRIKETSFTNNRAISSAMNPPVPEEDSTGGYGGALTVFSGTTTLKASAFDANKADKSGGAVTVGPQGTLHISENSKFINNSCVLGQGGAIQVRPYSYEDPADSGKYTNLTTDNTSVFENNKASFLYDSPSNDADFHWLEFARTSFTGKNILTNDSLLNNYDVNYKSSNEQTMYPVKFKFISDNSAYSLPAEVLALCPEESEAMVGVLVIPPVLTTTEINVQAGQWKFLGWDKAKAKMIDSELIFTGSWHFTAKEPTETTSPTETDAAPFPGVIGQREYTIIFKLNGGHINGSTADVIRTYPYGTVISILEAPERAGYEFMYWEGSAYYPRESYIVTGDHTFVACWAEKSGITTFSKPEGTSAELQAAASKLPRTGAAGTFYSGQKR